MKVPSADNEAATLCRKKRSDRPKRHTISSSSSAADSDQQEQEEVAMSLILLSMDCASSVFESYTKISIIGADQHCLKAPRKRLKSNEENEVNSPKTLIKKYGSLNLFGSDHKKGNSCTNSKANDCKFSCIICKRGFPSYQALGGHRASHKKFKGCSAPTTENTRDFQEKIIECKKSKEHKCPICFRLFPSGQALGGHKRSHLIGDQATRNIHPSFTTQKRMPQIRDYLDLNLPAPVEEECNEFKTWWIGINSS